MILRVRQISLLIFIVLINQRLACPTNSTCLENESCCQTKTGLWACCPFKDGVCCPDALHCCPNQQICSSNGTCLTLNDQSIKIKQITCQDGSTCPDGNTCCQLASGEYGCCPIENGVCCDDHIHCCPENHECEPKHGRCKKKSSMINEIQCPDGTYCPDESTCCPLESGDFGCCPLCDAVCCSDHLHCCPHGSTCDVGKSQCLTKENSINWIEKRPSFHHQYKNSTNISFSNKENRWSQLKVLVDDNDLFLCPDGINFCSSNSSCCSVDDLTWSCCSIEDPIFCSDGEHFCPKTYQCDLDKRKCLDSSMKSIDFIEKQLTIQLEKSSMIVKLNESSSFLTILCPDGIAVCPEDTTCCLLSDGSYGCCPYPQATCCSDQIHCCPNGYSCDKAGQRCTRHLNKFNRTEIIQSKSKKRIESFKDLIPVQDEQICPDGISKCPILSTCCPNVNSETYSCCPYTKGVCCGNNGSVCCPNKYVCDVQQLSCQLEDNRIRRNVFYSTDEYHQCGLSDVACASDQTCCRTYGSSDDQYACCGFSNAQCCEDGRHCCPSDSICDVQSGGCIQKY